jgi:hypothetical protein
MLSPRNLNSHSFAWQQTRGAPGFPVDSQFPVDHLIWATAAMANATSYLHLDANGLATAIDGVTGTKYWALARQRMPGSIGNMASIRAFGETEVDEAGADIFSHEAVMIQPGTVLFVV